MKWKKRRTLSTNSSDSACQSQLQQAQQTNMNPTRPVMFNVSFLDRINTRFRPAAFPRVLELRVGRILVLVESSLNPTAKVMWRKTTDVMDLSPTMLQDRERFHDDSLLLLGTVLLSCALILLLRSRPD
jgi:hypothetical protein